MATNTIPGYEQLGGDLTGSYIGSILFADYEEAGQAPNDGMGVWFMRTVYDTIAWSFVGMNPEVALNRSIAAHRREWRAQLGLAVGDNIAPVAPREYAGNMCGVRIDGLPPVSGGASDSSLVLSWFYDRYSPEDRTRIRQAWSTRGYRDVLLSWPDSRAAGASPEAFVETCRELVRDGFLPCVMLLSKDFDPHHDIPGCLANVNAVLPMLLNPRAVSRICIGWELSIWLTPTEVQQLTDTIAPQCVASDVKCYVHFQQGFAHFAEDGPNTTFATYWNLQVGKLTGILHQRDLNWGADEYAARLADITARFAGNFNVTPDSGFGHPFDCVALEITAALQFVGGMSEAVGDIWGHIALTSPPSYGPAGEVRVMGSGNGS